VKPDDTILGRCTVAYCEAFEKAIQRGQARRAGVAAVLEHLAAELLVLQQRDDRISIHEFARMLRLEAAGELAGWEQDQEVQP
jgi:hypothetical protein